MYRLAFSLLFLVLVLTLSVEGGIRCEADTCSKLECNGEQTKEACDAKGVSGRYKFIERGGACGCCHNCIKVLNENENCVETTATGLAPIAVCDDNLECHSESLLCIKKA